MKDKIVVNYWNHSKKLKKHKNKTIDTVIMKDNIYYGGNENRYNVEVNNFIIDLNSVNCDLNFYDLKSKNIYLNRKIDKNGLNIEVDVMLRTKTNKINFCWSTDDGLFASVDKLNIIYPDKTYTIDLKRDELKELSIRLLKDNTLDIDIKNVNLEINYQVTPTSIKEKINYIFVTKQDLKDGELDLTKFNDLSVIALGDLNVNSFKIKKEDISNLKYVKLYEYFFIENIKVIDGGEMKLNPEKIIPFNDELRINGNYIIGLKKEILIYLDCKNNIKVFDKNEILKDENIQQVDFIKNQEDYIIIYKGKNKYKLFIYDKEYDLTKLFMYYFKEVLPQYSLKMKDKNNTYKVISHDYEEFTDIIKNYLSIDELYKICEGYLIFKENLKALFKRGFTHEYFMYLHERDLDTVIFEMCKNSFDINKFTDFEIDSLNVLGKAHVKKLKK